MSETNSLNELPDTKMIKCLNKEFIEAIADISAQKVISFVADGENVNRFGEILLVTIGTQAMVYLFDVHKIGAEDFFINGIQRILESPEVLKVMHDVRMLCDCLKSKYHVLPINIFDTQVADAFIKRNENGSFPTEVASLMDCVVEHLNIPVDNCTFEGKQKIIKAAVYLIELRTVMLEKLLAEFLHGVDVYSKCMSHRTDDFVKCVNLKKLPQQFKKKFLSIKGNFPKDRQRIDDHSKDEDGDVETLDTGTEFLDKNRKRHEEKMIECLDENIPLIDTSKQLLRDKAQSPSDLKLSNKTQSQNVPILPIKIQTTGNSKLSINTRQKEKLQNRPQQFRKKHISMKGNLPKHRRRKDDYNKDKDDGVKRDSYNERSAWDNGSEFLDKYQKRHGDVIECLIKKEPLIDTSKPLLRTKTQSPTDLKQSNEIQSHAEDQKTSNHSDQKIIHQIHVGQNPSNNGALTNSQDRPSPVSLFNITNSREESNSKTHLADTQLKKNSDHLENFISPSPSDEQFNDSGERDRRPLKFSTQTGKKTTRIGDAGKQLIKNQVRRFVDVANLSLSPTFLVDPDEFPSLAELHEREKNQGLSINSSPSATSVGVKSSGSFKSLSRGQVWKSLTEQSKQVNRFENPISYNFPSDDELLNLPQITPQISGIAIAGEKVSVLKKINSN